MSQSSSEEHFHKGQSTQKYFPTRRDNIDQDNGFYDDQQKNVKSQQNDDENLFNQHEQKKKKVLKQVDYQDSQKSDSESNKMTKKKKIIKKQQVKLRKKNSKKTKRPPKQKLEEQIDQRCKQEAQNILKQMKDRYQKDIELYQRKKLAIKKLEYLPKLAEKLRNKTVQQYFLQQDGLFNFQKWLRKLTDGTEPNFTLKKQIFEILQRLQVRADHISKCRELLTLLQKHKKSNLKDLKNLSDTIVLKWQRILSYSYNDFNEDRQIKE